MAVMADDNFTSALQKRYEQIKRWEDSDTNIEPHSSRENKKVKFQNGCVFLAACSSGDRDEVNKLLDRGADINTANVDGLTALHQACIDDNLDMIEFLVEKNADIDVCDNEGWTPLHATASCGFTEIARYLIDAGVNVAAVNNDGDLPIDICEDDDMETLLQDVMTKQGVDAEAARREEEETMLTDANQLLTEIRHPKTGATALHVACAKGYIKVIGILLEAGVDVNSKDNDGWTPIHAAAHWGQDEACKLLADYMCDLEKKNNAGQTPFDVADSDMLQLLEELKKKQAARKDRNNVQDIIQNKNLSQRRRSSVTRMSVDQKHNVISKNTEQERATLDANLKRKNKEIENDIKPEKEEKIARSSSSSGSDEESSESETEKQNEKNRQTSNLNQPRDRDKPPIPATVEVKKPDMPKIDEVNEIGHIKSNNNKDPSINIIDEDGSGDRADIGVPITDNKRTEPEEREKDEKDTENQRQTAASESDKSDRIFTQRELVSRTISAPSSLPQITQVSQLLPQGSEVDQRPRQLSCSGLLRTVSTDMVLDSLIKDNNMMDKSLPRSASSPRLAHDNNTVGNGTPDKPLGRRPMHSTSSIETDDGKPTERYSSVYSRGTTFPYRNLTSISSSSTYQSAYIPYYRRKQEQNERREREKAGEPVIATTPAAITKGLTPPTSIAVTTRGPTQATMTLPSAAVPTTITATSLPTTIQNTVITTATTTTPTISSTTPSSNYITSYRSRLLYEPPKREEETETQRKARAKRARETRRSTQGVTLEEVKQAEQMLSATKEKEDKLKEQRKEEESVKERLSVSSIDNKDKKDNVLDDTSSRRRTAEDKRDEESRSSYRKSREARDLSSSAPSIYPSDSYINASHRGSAGISRTPSLRDRLRNGEADKNSEENIRKEIKEEKPQEKDEKKEPSAIKTRRSARERRSTGPVAFTPQVDDDKDKENKEDSKEDKKDTDEKGLSSRYGSRYSSSGDGLQTSLPDRYSRVDRSTSYTEFSKSTPSLDLDYKRLYEDEKVQNERLKKDLERTKKELSEAKLELDRLMRRNDSARIQDTAEKREKRALERKLSELEEEAKKMNKLKEEYNRLREENGALIRVISKLSK